MSGIIDLLFDYKERMTQKEKDLPPFPNIRSYLKEIYPGKKEKGKLYLLPSGQRYGNEFQNYANISAFDWRGFYQNWGGEIFFEWIREEFRNIADVVLIDSRTGVTEMGGICIYQLADVVLMFCAANRQNMEGTLAMAKNFSRSNIKELRNGRELQLLIIPARVELYAEGNQLNEYQDDFAQFFKDFLPEKTPPGEKQSDVFWELKIPYTPFYAFKERLVVKEKEKASAKTIVTAFNNITKILACYGKDKIQKAILG